MPHKSGQKQCHRGTLRSQRITHWEVIYVRNYCNSGKQYTVKEGDEIVIEKLGVEAGQTVTFDEVLFVGGENAKIGNPTVAGATVSATVVKEGRGKKVVVCKYKAKKGYTRKNGHRQPFTRVKIEKINA